MNLNERIMSVHCCIVNYKYFLCYKVFQILPLLPSMRGIKNQRNKLQSIFIIYCNEVDHNKFLIKINISDDKFLSTKGILNS